MAEIVEESNLNRKISGGANSSISNGNPPQDTVEIIVRIIGPARPSRLLAPSPIKVCDLRKLVAESSQLPIGNLKLILRGKIVDDCKDEDDVYVRLNHGDSLTVAVKPKPPAEHLRDEFDEDEDDLKFRLPESSSRLKKKVYTFLREKLKFPDILLMVIFSLSLKAWAAILIWFIVTPVAHSLDLGPLYILGTGFCIILLNLGHRQSGEMSAYSIFNEGFRELPGTLNADRLDRDVRLGRNVREIDIKKSWKNMAEGRPKCASFANRQTLHLFV